MQTDINPVNLARFAMPSDHNLWIQLLKLKDQLDFLIKEIKELKKMVLDISQQKDK